MKQLLRTTGLSLLAAAGMLVLAPGLAAAHVLKEDNGIAVVLHIPPEDNPEANQPTELDLSFGDAKNAFSLPDCACRVAVQNGGKVLQKAVPKPALAGAVLDATATVNFPAVGVYDVIVQGSAKDGRFPTFRLDYLVRVASSADGGPTAGSSGNGSEVVLIGAGGLAILAMLAYNSISIGGRYKPRPQSTTKSKRPVKKKIRRKP